MNLEYFKGFIETANHKSITKASEHLNISNQGLSKQIQKIETFFKIALFKRTPSGVELTKAGKMVYERFQVILNQLDLLQAELKMLTEVDTYTLGTLQSLAGTYLPQKILKLKEQGKTCKIVVKNTSDELVQLLKDEKIDGAIVEQTNLSDSFRSKKLFKEPFYIILPNSHQLSNKNSLTIEDIWPEPFVLHPPACTIRQRLANTMRQKGYELKIGTEVDFNDHLMGYVIAGAGIAVIPKITVSSLNSSWVKAVPFLEPYFHRTISLVTNSIMVEEQLVKYLL